MQFVELTERPTLLKTSRAIDVVGSLVAITCLPLRGRGQLTRHLIGEAQRELANRL